MKIVYETLIFIIIQILIFSDVERNINKIIYFGKDGANQISSLNMINNDVLLLSLFTNHFNLLEFNIYGLNSLGKDYFNDSENNYTIFYSENFNFLNGITIKIEEKEYPFICSSSKCLLFDYENNNVYEESINVFFYDENNIISSNYLIIINMNKENKILFIQNNNSKINLGVIKIK